MPISDEKIIASKHPLGCSQGKFPNHKKGEVKFEIYLKNSRCGCCRGGGETIILGAFGCEEFRNNPEVVALANKNVIKEYLHAFKNIEYAIYCGRGDDSNYRIFERVLRPYLKKIGNMTV